METDTRCALKLRVARVDMERRGDGHVVNPKLAQVLIHWMRLMSYTTSTHGKLGFARSAECSATRMQLAPKEVMCRRLQGNYRNAQTVGWPAIVAMLAALKRAVHSNQTSSRIRIDVLILCNVSFQKIRRTLSFFQWNNLPELILMFQLVYFAGASVTARFS
ncbi:hypothetical protein ACQJBY_000706 [Aegilops geniculata]